MLVPKRKVHSFTVKVPCVYIFICQMFEFVFCKSNMFFQKSQKHALVVVFLQSAQSCNAPSASADEYVFHFPERSWQRSSVSVQSMTQRASPAQRRAAPTQPCWPSFACSGKQTLHHRPENTRSSAMWSPTARTHTTMIVFFVFNLVSHTHWSYAKTNFSKTIKGWQALTPHFLHCVPQCQIWREICRVALQHRGRVCYGRWWWQMVD